MIRKLVCVTLQLALVGAAFGAVVEGDVLGKSQAVVIPFNATTLPEVDGNIVTRDGRSLDLLKRLHEGMLPLVIRELGMIECAGLDHSFGGNFFEKMLGPGADVGGNYLCQPTCGGECVVTQGLREAPSSIYYPFGCRCPMTRCNAHGPIITDLIQPIFKVLCVKDDRCTCASMGPPNTHTGYLCNWINLNDQKSLTYLARPFFPEYPPTRSPVRWCSCCPAGDLI